MHSLFTYVACHTHTRIKKKLKQVIKQDYHINLKEMLAMYCSRENWCMSCSRKITKKPPHLKVFKKCWNISKINASHSRSSITTHDRTFATVSRIETLFVYDRLDMSSNLLKVSTILWKTTWIFTQHTEHYN